MWIFHARISAIAAETVVSDARIGSQQPSWTRRSLEFGTYRSSAPRGSDCCHSHVPRSTARRSLLCDLSRQFTRDETALRTSALWGAGSILQGRHLSPPGICLYRGPLSAQEKLLRPQQRLIRGPAAK